MSPNKSHLTAIVRKALPGPTKWLLNRGLLVRPVLDYGCGRSHEVNNQFFQADGYDPHYRPDGIKKILYITIVCNYVLCVIPTEEERREVLKTIQSYLKSNPKGLAYISVRNDTPKQGHGWSSSGTFQAKVDLPLPLLHKTQLYRMYTLTKDDKF